MSLIQRIPGVTFADATLPKLYRDGAITAGTKAAFDSADTYSYAKQAAPVAGDAWTDLSPNGNNGAVVGTVGFAGGGFVFASSTFGNEITLNAACKRAAGDPGMLNIIWLKHLAVNSSQSFGFVAGEADNNNANMQWLVDTGALNSGLYRPQIGPVTYSHAPALNAVFQLALAAKKLNGVIEYYVYVNGVQVSRNVSAEVALRTATQPLPKIGGTQGPFPQGANFRAFRYVHDDTSALATEAAITALVAADYAANVGRFA